MGSSLLKYIITSIIFSLSGIIILDYILLPNYVGYNNEHYLPDLRGVYSENANYQLKSMGFRSEIITVPYSKDNTPGTVVKMFPRAFTKVKEGRTISLTIAGNIQSIQIPYLVNKTLRNAKLNLAKLGIGIDTIIYEYDNLIDNGNITFQVPDSGKIVSSATFITIGVSKGSPPDYYIVPNLININFIM